MSPIFQQMKAAKDAHPGVLMAIRLGDFYEFWDDDAETVAKALGITLTGRNDGEIRHPMCGVPFHSVEKYLARLLMQGFKVALCDQLDSGATHIAIASDFLPGEGYKLEDYLPDSMR